MTKNNDALCAEIDLMSKWVKNNTRTLRDEFAMAALTGLLAHGEPEYCPAQGQIDPRYIQDTAYRLADAMLAAREAK